MTEKYLFMFNKSNYKTIEVEGTELDNGGIKYNSPYTEQIEELQRDGWQLYTINKVTDIKQYQYQE